MNLRQFKERLAKHDWHYSSSDDDRVYERGLAEENALKSLMKGKVSYQNAYQSQFNKHFKNK